MAHSTGIHNLHARRQRKRTRKKSYIFYDKFMIVVSVLVPLSNLPQLFKIWNEKNAAGVSSLSWVLFAIFSLTWLWYGIIHKSKPIIIMHSFLFLIQVAIAVGSFIYS